jgi:hypothetical protein
MKIYLTIPVLLGTVCSYAKSGLTDTGTINANKPKTDTVKGVVIYTAPTHAVHIFKNNYHTYTEEAKLIKTDTGIIGIKTQFGYLDLKKNYQFIPLDQLQPAQLKSKP